jgi:molecular chaperone DnaK (HSP70)
LPIKGQFVGLNHEERIAYLKEEQKNKESEQNFAQITELIQQIEAALTQNDLTQATQLITKLKELAEQPNNLINSDQLNATIAGLEQKLQEQTQLLASNNPNP